MTDRIVTIDELKALIRGNPDELTPEKVFGREFMTAWRAKQDDIDRIALTANIERIELERLRSEKAAPAPEDKPGAKKGDDDKTRFTDPARNPFIPGSSAPQPEKPAKAKDPNEKYLNPESNPFIKPL